MKRPSFQFYPADWRNNPNLRRCSPAARGVWMDVLCVLHASPEYGVCRWPLADLVHASCASPKLIRELILKEVLKGAEKNAEPFIFAPTHAGQDGEPVVLVVPGDGPCWYCSRLVRDEWVRKTRGAKTRFVSENMTEKPPPDPSPTHRVGEHFGEELGDGPSSSSSSSSSSNTAAGLSKGAVSDPRVRAHGVEPGAPDGAAPPGVGAVCMAMKQAGLGICNPSHAELQVLIDKGATIAMFVSAAKKAVARRKNFAYAIGVLKGQMAEAAMLADTALAPFNPAAAPGPRNGDTKYTACAQAVFGKPKPKPGGEVIDV